MNVGRDTGGAAPCILSLSTKQGEFQATDAHHWRSTSQHLLKMELVGPFWMVSRRNRSLTPDGDRTTIPRSFTPWRIYKADSRHPGSDWMHLALDIDADGLYNCLSLWQGEAFGGRKWIELSDFICMVVMTGARRVQSVGCGVDGTGFDSHRDKKYLYSVIYSEGARGSAFGRSRFRFPMVSLEFFIDTILFAALCPWGRLNF
jgi:hypothetical protein